jgi:outer membrane receptor protein involved in Fe transport
VTALRLTFVWIALACSLCGQTARISGEIRDPSALPIQNAQISLLNEQTGGRRVAWSNEAGAYSLPSLSPGLYRITVRAPGFQTSVTRGLRLEVGDDTRLDIPLRLGDARTVVTVQADTPLMNNENASVGTVIDRRTIDRMPLNGRGIQALIELSPGVVAVPVEAPGDGQFVTNGQRNNANYITVDGATANFALQPMLANLYGPTPQQIGTGMTSANNFLGTYSNLVSPEALQEFRIQTSTFAPEFGRAPGAQIALVTRSGTNQYAGSLFEYLRNDKTDANDWFLNRYGLAKRPLRFNNFGGTIGGPVRLPHLYDGRNRTFFFLSAEASVLVQHYFPTRYPVPTLQARLNAPAMVAPLLNAYPLPNRPPNKTDRSGFAQYVADSFVRYSQQTYGLRLDHAFSDSLLSFARYNRAPAERLRALEGPSVVQREQLNTETLTFGLTHTITPSLVNEVRLNASRQDSGGAWGISAPAVAWAESLLFPPGYSSRDGFARFAISPAPPLSVGQFPRERTRQLQAVDNLSAIVQAHQLKFGVDYRWYSPARTINRYEGYFGFQGLYGPSGAYQATLSEADLTFYGSPNLAYLFQAFSAYAQDTWRVTPKLALTYGLRWEVVPGPRLSAGQAVIGTVSRSGSTSVTLLPRGQPAYRTSWTNLAPRFGLAYQLRSGAAKNTVLRLGAGRYFDLGQSGMQGPPWYGTTLVYYRNQPLGSWNGGTLDAKYLPSPPSLTGAGAVPVVPADYRLPYTWQWNATLEQSLGPQTISAGYVGALGRRLAAWSEYSPHDPATYYIFRSNESRSAYHAMQVQFNRRLSTRLHLLLSYTWSHSIDDLSSDQRFLFPGGEPTSRQFQPRQKGPSDFDIRHALNGSVIADLPAPATGLKSVLFRHWSANSIFFLRTAVPSELFADSSGRRPDWVPGQPLYRYGPEFPGGKGFNRAAFAPPPPGRDGTLGRNVLRGLGAWQVDLGLHREFRLTEKLRCQFRLEAFNVFNHPNFANPTNNQGTVSPSKLTLPPSPEAFEAGGMLYSVLSPFGQVGELNSLFQIGGPRTLQFALRLRF